MQISIERNGATSKKKQPSELLQLQNGTIFPEHRDIEFYSFLSFRFYLVYLNLIDCLNLILQSFNCLYLLLNPKNSGWLTNKSPFLKIENVVSSRIAVLEKVSVLPLRLLSH